MRAAQFQKQRNVPREYGTDRSALANRGRSRARRERADEIAARQRGSKLPGGFSRQCGAPTMIHVYTLGRAVRYYPEQTALSSGGTRRSFRELRDRVAGIAAALGKHGFQTGDRLALLLPNEPDYLELVYACAWLGVIAVPVNTRLSVPEIDHLIADANPRGLIRHSSLPVPTVKPPWELVLDQEPLDVQSDSHPRADLRPGSDLSPGLHQRHNGTSQRRGRDSRQHSGEYRPLQLLGALSRRRRASSRRANFSHLGFPIHVCVLRRSPSDNPKVRTIVVGTAALRR